MRRSSRSDACSRYQRSSSIRSGQGSDARPLTCAQPVRPGRDGEPPALAVGVVVDLDLQRRARPDQRHLAAQHVDQVRQLVDRRAAQERADAGDPRVALVDRHPGAHVLGAGDHRAQLDRPRTRARPCRRGAGGRSGGRGDSSRTASAASATTGAATSSARARRARGRARACGASAGRARSPRALRRVPARPACRGAASRTGRRRARRW